MSANCSKFCKGGIQSDRRLRTINLDADSIFTGWNNKSSLIKKQVHGKWLCPLECTCNPKTEEATKNVIDNNGEHTICHANKWLTSLLEGECNEKI